MLRAQEAQLIPCKANCQVPSGEGAEADSAPDDPFRGRHGNTLLMKRQLLSTLGRAKAAICTEIQNRRPTVPGPKLTRPGDIPPG
jgi:hypothetical protein